MKRVIKNWSRKRRAKKRQRNDFSDDIRRAERRKKLSNLAPAQLIRKIGIGRISFSRTAVGEDPAR